VTTARCHAAQTLSEGWFDTIDATCANQLLADDSPDKQTRADEILEHTLPRLYRHASGTDPELTRLVRAVMAHSTIVHLGAEEFELALEVLQTHCHPFGASVVAEAKLARLTRTEAPNSLPDAKRFRVDRSIHGVD